MVASFGFKYQRLVRLPAGREDGGRGDVALSTGHLSRAARGSVIVRRAGGSDPGAKANRLVMHEVQLPARVVPVLERFAT